MTTVEVDKKTQFDQNAIKVIGQISFIPTFRKQL
jgi:hypothetical protein